MKYKTTRKAIVNDAVNVRRAGYGELQALLANHEPTAYTTGAYGWNFDVYEVYGVTICTGYRNMPGARLEQTHEYEKKAANIWSRKGSRPFKENQTEVEKLLKEFCLLNGGVCNE